jgi:hypothetical protein
MAEATYQRNAKSFLYPPLRMDSIPARLTPRPPTHFQ